MRIVNAMDEFARLADLRNVLQFVAYIFGSGALWLSAHFWSRRA